MKRIHSVLQLGCVALQLAAFLTCACCVQVATAAISLFQWNPHWECFAQNRHNCAARAEAQVKFHLMSTDADFANIVGLEDHDYVPPSGWEMFRQQCGQDVSLLIYNTKWWTPSVATGSAQRGCILGGHRPFVVQQFDGVLGQSVVIVGAHFPHNGDKKRGPLRDAIANAVKATGIDSVIMMADTSENRSVSNQDVALDLAFPAGPVVGSELVNTCCEDIGYTRPYDRIIANYGTVMDTVLLFDKMPSWAHGKMHNGIKGTLVGIESVGSPQQKFAVGVGWQGLRLWQRVHTGSRLLASAIGSCALVAIACFFCRRVRTSLWAGALHAEATPEGHTPLHTYE